MNILFAASEAFPFIKTGGLGDVVHSLPAALNKLGDDVRLVLPAYRDVLAGVDSKKVVGNLDIPGAGNRHKVRIIQAHQEELGDYLYLIDAPLLFDRPGNPYVHSDGYNWPDNAERFTVFCRSVALLAKGIPGLRWTPDVVHCHDWQTGLLPAFLSLFRIRPKTVFTIHNLAYDGHFSHEDFTALSLPAGWWSPENIEFYGGMSMIKAGMIFSDHVTTVSPTYAREICTHEYGYRFEGVLQSLGDRLTGILNGIDLDIWNPATDEYIAKPYHPGMAWQPGKAVNKAQLLKDTGLPVTSSPLLGFIGRMVEQKGVDLIIEMLPVLFEQTDAVMIVLGSGEGTYESDLTELARQYPQRLHVHIGYSEELAHKVEAGCDLFLMPSRFEPCGLNQMYSLRYGTPPVVNNTGGLADTVIDSNAATIVNGTANGFVLNELTAEGLLSAIERALFLYRKPARWKQICETAMSKEMGWDTSAKEYRELYSET